MTAGAGGFVDITARAKRIVFSGPFRAGARVALNGEGVRIEREGRASKIVDKVEQVSFSGRRAATQGQDVTYVTERCVMRLTVDGPTITEVAPGIDLERDVLAQADIALKVAADLKTMPAALYRPGPVGLTLGGGGSR